MKIENMLQRFTCISFLFKPPWSREKEKVLFKIRNLVTRSVKVILRIFTGKKRPKIRLRKIQIWTFGSLVHQITSF